MAATATTVPRDPVRERLLSPWPRLNAAAVALVIVLMLAYSWGLQGTQANPAELARGAPYVARFVARLMPPQWKMELVPLATPAVTLPFGLALPSIGAVGMVVQVPEIAFAIVETIQMALIGTTVAAIISLPFGLLAARNTSPHRWVYVTTRLLLNANRAIPEIIFALIFVAAVGLGPFSGVAALSVGAVGFMGKLYAEAIEAIDPQQVQAVSATGANRLQTFVYGVVPQALPLVASYSLLLFETNVRHATILGIVGAGGVGFVLSKYMALFQYQYLMGALILIIVTVTVIDRISDALRRRLI
jgi:phosphonate transport system permease protein